MQFDLFRMSLTLRSQPSFDQTIQYGDSIPSRESWLRETFSQNIQFSVKGKTYHYTLVELGEKIWGRIGHDTIKTENLSPEEQFQEVERLQWRASQVLIDPTKHEDGQKLIFEVNPDVGSATSILIGLAKFINENWHHSPYFLDIGAISEPQSFWEFVNSNRGQITSISFEVSVPNMFGHEGDYDEELRKFRDEEKAQIVTTKIKNPDGLNVDTKTINAAVAYTSKAGGEIKASAKNRKTYNSRKSSKRVQAEDVLTLPGLAERLASLIRRKKA